jgi:hypothetical protein
MADQSSSPSVTAGIAALYVDNSAPDVLFFKDDTGLDRPISHMGPIFIDANSMIPKISGGSFLTTHGGEQTTMDFVNTATPTCYAYGMMPLDYTGGNITATLIWGPSSTNTGAIDFDLQMENLGPGEDYTADGSAGVVTNTDAANGNINEIQYSTFTLTAAGTNDTIVAGSQFRLTLTRNATDAFTGTMEVLGIKLEEF